MKDDFVKHNDREDVSPFLRVFLYCPAILFICECACVCRHYLLGAPWLQVDHHLDFSYSPPTPDLWALTLKPKKEEKKQRIDEERISSNSAILCVLY